MDSTVLLADLIVSLYFFSKRYLIYQKFKFFKPLETNIAISIIHSLLTIGLHHMLVQDFNNHLDGGFIKGSITLPPFTVLFILADFISTIILVAILKHRKMNDSLLFEFGRFVFLYVIFTELVSILWLNIFTQKYANTDYLCFKYQLQQDVGEYYIQNLTFPTQLEDATNITVNPLNDSPLFIENPHDLVAFKVKDEKTNVILSGTTDFLGRETLATDPDFLQKMYQQHVSSYCK